MSAAPITWDEYAAWDPERTWSRDEFELLPVDAVEQILLRRLRKLVDRGYDPSVALRLAARVDRAI